MDILGLLADFQRIGFIVELGSAGKLRVDGPAHPEAAQLIATLAKHKAQVIAALSAPASGYERFPLVPNAEQFLIEAPHDPADWQEPERKEGWADKRQLAQIAADLAAQNVIGREAYHMATYAGYTAKEAGYVAKMIRTGEWRPLLESSPIMPKADRLAALLMAA